MEITVNFVLFEELEKKPESAIDTHIVIVRPSKDQNLSFEDGAVDWGSPE